MRNRAAGWFAVALVALAAAVGWPAREAQGQTGGDAPGAGEVQGAPDVPAAPPTETTTATPSTPLATNPPAPSACNCDPMTAECIATQETDEILACIVSPQGRVSAMSVSVASPIGAQSTGADYANEALQILGEIVADRA